MPGNDYARWKKEVKKLAEEICNTRVHLDVLTLYGEYAKEMEWKAIEQSIHEARMLNRTLEYTRIKLANRAKGDGQPEPWHCPSCGRLGDELGCMMCNVRRET